MYLANWWSGTPDTWAAELQEGWTDRIGRAPVFWDNQQQNDFRCAVVLPMPLHQRPAGFGHALDGYTLNSGVPMPAYAGTSVTAGAWAWNPDGYDAGAALGVAWAIARFFGPAGPAVTDALRALGELLGGLMAPRQGMEQHYRGLWQVAKAGEGAAVREGLDEITVRSAWLMRDVSRQGAPSTLSGRWPSWLVTSTGSDSIWSWPSWWRREATRRRGRLRSGRHHRHPGRQPAPRTRAGRGAGRHAVTRWPGAWHLLAPALRDHGGAVGPRPPPRQARLG